MRPAPLLKFEKSEEEGISLANDSRYGLGAGIWTQDLSRAHRVSAAIEAGLVWVNTHHRNDPSSPWYAELQILYGLLLLTRFYLRRGGMKESGIGRENGVEAYESCQSIPPLPDLFS